MLKIAGYEFIVCGRPDNTWSFREKGDHGRGHMVSDIEEFSCEHMSQKPCDHPAWVRCKRIMLGLTVEDGGRPEEVLVPGNFSCGYHSLAEDGERMKEHQVRVMAEIHELDVKLKWLGIFITGQVFAELDDDEKERLVRQHGIMREYLAILTSRLAACGGE